MRRNASFPLSPAQLHDRLASISLNAPPMPPSYDDVFDATADDVIDDVPPPTSMLCFLCSRKRAAAMTSSTARPRDLSGDKQQETKTGRNANTVVWVGDNENRFGQTKSGCSASESLLDEVDDGMSSKYRLVTQKGKCNVTMSNVHSRGRKFFTDLFTTLVDLDWGQSVALFVLILVGSWLIFALIWWLIAVNEYDPQRESDSNTSYPDEYACVSKVKDFHAALLFSVETQHTIGYGTRSVNLACPFSTIALMLQSCVGVLITSLLAGLTFAKLARPVTRGQTVMFSRRAVICRRDGVYCLLFRVGDMRRSHIVRATVRAMVVRWSVGPDGDRRLNPQCQHPLQLETDTGNTESFVFMLWPMTVVHRITEKSPLWDLSEEQLKDDGELERLEIIVVMEGTVEITGRSVQIRTSYLASEIDWGARLEPLLTYEIEPHAYEIDFKAFHKTTKLDVPMRHYSARQYAARRRRRQDLCHDVIPEERRGGTGQLLQSVEDTDDDDDDDERNDISMSFIGPSSVSVNQAGKRWKSAFSTIRHATSLSSSRRKRENLERCMSNQ